MENILPEHQIKLPVLNNSLYITQHYHKIKHDDNNMIEILLDSFYQ